MHNETWTLNYCSHPHTEKPYQVIMFFILMALTEFLAEKVGEKVLKTLWYQKQEYNIDELSNGGQTRTNQRQSVRRT